MLQFPRWQMLLVLAVLLLGVAFASPNLIPGTSDGDYPDWVPHKQVNLGLDLQGGSYLLIEVDLGYAFGQQFDDLEDGLRRELRRTKIPYQALGVYGDAVGFDLSDPATLDQARGIVRDVAGGFEIEVTNDSSFRLRLSEAAKRDRQTAIMSQTIEIITRRLDETGTKEPTVQRHGDERVLIQLPGVGDPERIKKLLGQTAALAFRFVSDNPISASGKVPAGYEVLESDRPDPQSGVARRYIVSKRVIVKGESLTDAQGTFQDGQSVVSFAFDTGGGKRFADATRDNVGRIFAVVLDNKVISAPVIRSPILGGRGIIEGGFTVETAQDLALLLRAGALPAPLTYLEERSVGPGLGADSIRAGKIAAVLGMVFVVIFMALAYGLFGIMADFALLANLVLILAVLSGLQATLTLPGIAGIVLTIGMAVDANVLIFERIREEAHINGRGPVTAIDAGYRRAMTTIIDSNLTTLIAAILLFQFGSGPIKGFAVTLAIGIISSMFTAIMFTRLMVTVWLRRRRPQALAI